MPLPGSVAIAPAGLLGFDTDTVVTPETAAKFFAQGFRFCIRYVSRGAQQGSSDLTTSEALGILGAGLALAPVQHVRAEGWMPAPGLGATDGVHAAYHASVLGFPSGINVWCDLEGVAGQATAELVIDYCNGWFDAVAAAGFAPGLYVGANAILDGQALHERLKFSHYWKSLSKVPQVAVRGYQMIQSNEHSVNGIGIDEDRTQNDLLGVAVVWLSPASPIAPPPGIAT
jgi:hypothetical protein